MNILGFTAEDALYQTHGYYFTITKGAAVSMVEKGTKLGPASGFLTIQGGGGGVDTDCEFFCIDEYKACLSDCSDSSCRQGCYNFLVKKCLPICQIWN